MNYDSPRLAAQGLEWEERLAMWWIALLLHASARGLRQYLAGAAPARVAWGLAKE